MSQVFWLFDVGVISGVKEEWNLSVWGRKSKICFAFLQKGGKAESTTPLGFSGGSVVKNPSASGGDSGRWFMTLYRRQGSGPSPRRRNAKSKWLSEEALQKDVEKREATKEKRKDIPI